MPRAIRELRVERGLTQEALARLVGVSSLSVSDWENLYKRPRQESVEKLATVLEVPVEEIELAPAKKTGPPVGWKHTPETKARISQRVREARNGQHGHEAVASGEAA